MSTEALTEQDVLDAAALLVDAFRSNDGPRYFGCFADSATFVFHSEPRFPFGTAEYAAEWQGWIDGGWRVAACTSSAQQVQLAGDSAVFSHVVETVTTEGGVSTTAWERETIVFARVAGVLTAIHEHLSVLPR